MLIARGMAIATVVLWATSHIWSKQLLTWLDPIAAAEARFAVSALTPVLTTAGAAVVLGDPIGLSLGATVLGYLFWNRSVRALGVGEPNLYYNFIPVLIMIMAWLRASPPHLEQMIGAALVVAGVTLSMAPERHHSPIRHG